MIDRRIRKFPPGARRVRWRRDWSCRRSRRRSPVVRILVVHAALASSSRPFPAELHHNPDKPSRYSLPFASIRMAPFPPTPHDAVLVGSRVVQRVDQVLLISRQQPGFARCSLSCPIPPADRLEKNYKLERAAMVVLYTRGGCSHSRTGAMSGLTLASAGNVIL